MKVSIPGRPQLAPDLPERDSWEDGLADGNGRQVPIALSAWIHYRDADGQESRRDILTKRLLLRDDKVFAISAFCEARQSNRTFRVSRILQFVDRQTGEVVPQVFDYLWQAYCETPAGRVERAISERLSEVNVLAFVARADGSMREGQRSIIADYLTRGEPKLIGCDAEVTSAISALRPQQTEYRKHVRDLKSKPENERSALLQAAEAIAATRTTKREFTDSALQVARKALAPRLPPKAKRPKLIDPSPNEDL